VRLEYDSAPADASEWLRLHAPRSPVGTRLALSRTRGSRKIGTGPGGRHRNQSARRLAVVQGASLSDHRTCAGGASGRSNDMISLCRFRCVISCLRMFTICANGRNESVGIAPRLIYNKLGPPAATSVQRRRLPSGVTTVRRHSPRFLPVSIVLRPVFRIVSPCSCAGGFSLGRARRCIVIGVAFSL